MYTLRVEERGERRVSSLVPRQTAAATAAATAAGDGGSGDAAAAAAAAAATTAAGKPDGQTGPRAGQGGHDDDDGEPPSLYDEVFRAPVPDGGAVQFSAGNPRVEHINGLVHLYRRTAAPPPPAVPGAGGAGGASSSAAAAKAAAAAAAAAEGPSTSRTVCCLAIPSDMAVASFCSFIGAYLEHARELRVLRREGLGGARDGGSGGNGGNGGGGGGQSGNGSGNSTGNGGGGSVCMVLVEFERQAQADDFFADYNGRPFSSLEPEILCRLVYVREVEVVEAGRRQQQQQQGQLQKTAAATTKAGGGSKDKGAAAAASASGAAAAQLPPAPFLPAPPGHTELPSCPVCLERLDEHVTGGIVTTVCNHQFHSECLQRWGDTSCPVCRYCAFGGRDAAATSRCEACGERGDTWMCLICGSTGCGRYRGGAHAVRHYDETGHAYALELETQRVWSYSADCFVHRLILSKVDGKLVELPSPAARRQQGGGGGGPGGGGAGGGGGFSYGALPAGPSGGGGGGGRGGGGGADEAGSSGLPGGRGEAYCGGADGRPPHPAACAHHRRRRSLHYAGGGGGGGGAGGAGAGAGAPSPRGGGGGGGGYGYGDALAAGHGPPPPCGACPECRADEHVKEALVASKLDALSLEYTHLLTTQLESQRLFFESRLAAAEADAARAIAAAGEEADASRRRAESSDAAHREADRRRAAAERRLELALADARRAEEERGFLRTLNETLRQNAAELRKNGAAGAEALRRAEADALDLREQVRDLMMALEARSMVERSGGGELEGATLLPVPQSELERRKAARDRRRDGAKR